MNSYSLLFLQQLSKISVSSLLTSSNITITHTESACNLCLTPPCSFPEEQPPLLVRNTCKGHELMNLRLRFIHCLVINLTIHSCVCVLLCDRLVVGVGFYGNREAEKGLDSVIHGCDSVISAVRSAQMEVRRCRFKFHEY